MRWISRRSFSRAGGYALMVLGAAVLIGWALDLTVLTRIDPSLEAMRPNTAVAFFLTGSALVRLTGVDTRVPRESLVIGALVAAIGGVTTLEYVTGMDLGIDRLLLDRADSGRMALPTALAFLGLGGGLVTWRSSRATSDTMILIAGGIGLLGLVGYAYGAKGLYQIGPYAGMAVHTAAGLVLGSAAALAVRLDGGWLAVLTRDSAGGAVARRLLPAAVLAPLLLGGARLVGLRAGLVDIELGAALVTLANIFVLSALVISIAIPLDRSDRSRRAAERGLRELNESLEARVRERTAELESANRELEAFVFAVSHDLTGPLRSMRGFVHLIERRGAGLDDDGKRYLGLLRQGTEEMARLISAMVDLSTITRTDITRERVDVSALATDIVSELRRSDPRRDVAVDIEPGLTARADPTLTRAALANLLGNAWKFTAHTDRARLELRRLGPAPGTFYVRDNGAGFDADAAEHLFAPFQRLHSPDDFPGTGIGLATVQRIVRRHGGRVWAEGKVGEGATFYFTLEP